MINYYVYYRVDEGRVASLRAEIEMLFHEIQKQFGIRGRWMRRRDDASTFMEVYEGVKDEQAFELLLAREGATLQLERKIERFVSA